VQFYFTLFSEADQVAPDYLDAVLAIADAACVINAATGAGRET
jgi:hypothetical protein